MSIEEDKDTIPLVIFNNKERQPIAVGALNIQWTEHAGEQQCMKSIYHSSVTCLHYTICHDGAQYNRF